MVQVKPQDDHVGDGGDDKKAKARGFCMKWGLSIVLAILLVTTLSVFLGIIFGATGAVQACEAKCDSDIFVKGNAIWAADDAGYEKLEPLFDMPTSEAQTDVGIKVSEAVIAKCKACCMRHIGGMFGPVPEKITLEVKMLKEGGIADYNCQDIAVFGSCTDHFKGWQSKIAACEKIARWGQDLLNSAVTWFMGGALGMRTWTVSVDDFIASVKTGTCINSASGTTPPATTACMSGSDHHDIIKESLKDTIVHLRHRVHEAIKFPWGATDLAPDGLMETDNGSLYAIAYLYLGAGCVNGSTAHPTDAPDYGTATGPVGSLAPTARTERLMRGDCTETASATHASKTLAQCWTECTTVACSHFSHDSNDNACKLFNAGNPTAGVCTEQALAAKSETVDVFKPTYYGFFGQLLNNVCAF